MSTQLNWKKTPLLTPKILRLLLNTLAVDDKYPLLNRDNLTIPIQRQLSQKQKTFSRFFAKFSKSRITFEELKKKDDPYRFFYFQSYGLRKRSLKNPFTVDHSTSNMVNVPKQC